MKKGVLSRSKTFGPNFTTRMNHDNAEFIRLLSHGTVYNKVVNKSLDYSYLILPFMMHLKIGFCLCNLLCRLRYRQTNRTSVYENPNANRGTWRFMGGHQLFQSVGSDILNVFVSRTLLYADLFAAVVENSLRSLCREKQIKLNIFSWKNEVSWFSRKNVIFSL